MKEKFELQYLFKTSPKILENKITSASGLGEWFADDVNIKDEHYFFTWDGYDEEAKLLSIKLNQHIKFQWISDIEEGLDTYVEMSFTVDAMTNAISLLITDFAYPEDRDSSILMWEQQIQKLRRLIGA